jgi:hypothetical protein
MAETEAHLDHIREHDDRPYRCLRPGCDRRFTTPTEQRVHEALHRIKNLGIVPDMPAFSAPIAPTSTTAPVPQPTSPVTVAQEVKADKPPVPHDEESEPALPPEAFRPSSSTAEPRQGEASTSEPQQPPQPPTDQPESTNPPENRPSDSQNTSEQPAEGGAGSTSNP